MLSSAQGTSELGPQGSEHENLAEPHLRSAVDMLDREIIGPEEHLW